ncbi:MAG: hypothetical protein HY906_02280 [Deltaproteobacteria bacterium]|nr:hypothetical protein [Deltaproteobacteria bacterium]
MKRSALYISLLSLVLAALVGCNLFKKKAAVEADVAAPQGDQAPAVEEVPAIPEPDGGLAEPVTEGESTAAADALLEQMKAGGLTASAEFKKVGAKYGAKNCLEGKLDEIPTMLCEYADADGAKAGKEKMEEWAKDMPTGVVDRNGKTLLGAKASKDLDKNNDKVNKIITAFNKAK